MRYTYSEKFEGQRQPVKQADTPKKSVDELREAFETGGNLPESMPPLIKSPKLMSFNDKFSGGQPKPVGGGMDEVIQEIEYISLKDQIKLWIDEEEEDAEGVMDYPAVTQIPIEMFPNPEAIWNFCVAYAATAMMRRAKPEEMITIAAGQIGIYYMAALTLFYSIEEASAGRIPPIQMLSIELRDMLYATAPTNRGNKSWVVTWEDYDLLSLINSLPYNAYQNPSITLAPWTGAESAAGRKILQTTTLNVSFEDLNEVGPQAFEIIQRYMLGTHGNARLYPYTEDGDTTNTAMFAFSRDPNQVNPVDGYRQIVLETPLLMRDVAYYSLNFFGDKNGRRDGWSPRTTQISTVPMMHLIAKGRSAVPRNLKYQVHMINYSTVVFNFLLQAVTAVFNSRDDRTIGGVVAGQFPDGYLDTLSAGELLTSVLQYTCRRYAVHSAWAAGTVLPEENCKIIGAGSRYVTEQYVDNYHTFLPLIEQLAGTSSFLDIDYNNYLCPVLTSRGDIQTVDYFNLGGVSLMSVLAAMYPALGNVPGLIYDMAPASVLPDTITFSPLGTDCLTAGSGPRNAGDAANSVVSSLQAYCAIGAAVGSRDGSYHKGLYLTHYLDDELDVTGFDITVHNTVVAALSTYSISARSIATRLSCFAPVMYGPSNGNLVGAYQVLLHRNNSIQVNDRYIMYRAAREVADGHKRAANINAPDEYGIHIASETYAGNGGAFFSKIMVGGRMLDTGSRMFARVLDLIAPEVAKKVNPYIDRGREGIKHFLGESEKNALHFTPVEHGLVHPETLFHAMKYLEENGGYTFASHAPKQLNLRGKGRLPYTANKGGKKKKGKKKTYQKGKK